MVARYEEKKDT